MHNYIKRYSVFFAFAFLVSQIIFLINPFDVAYAANPPVDESRNVEFVGQTGGIINTVFAQGNYAYLGQGPRLVILDVSDISFVSIKGQTRPLTGIVLDVFVSGNYAYVIDGNLWIIDISDLSNPVPVGFYDTGGDSRRVAVAGQYAFVINDYHLDIVNVSSPTSPAQTGTYFAPGLKLWDVAVSGNYVYLTDQYNGLQAINVSNPAAPAHVGCFPLNNALRIVVRGIYAYVAAGSNGLHIVDISNPANLQGVGSHSVPFWASDVTLLGNYAYVAAENYGMQILNVSNPVNPVEVGRYKGYWGANSVSADIDRAYVVDERAGVSIIDASNPMYPFERRFYRSPSFAGSVSTKDSYAYVGYYALAKAYVEYGGGYCQGDFSNIPIPPPKIRAASLPEEKLTLQSTQDYESGLSVVNVSVSQWPNEEVFYPISTASIDSTIVDNYLYMADRYFRIMDISNPPIPGQTSIYTATSIYGATVVNGYAYIAAGSKLQILNVSNPAMPTPVGSTDTPAINVAVSGNYAYIAQAKGLQVVDVSNPAAPVQVGHYQGPPIKGWVYDVTIGGDYAYLAAGVCFSGCSGSLRILDISHPATPVEIGAYELSGAGSDIVLVGSYVYLATEYGGVRIFDVSDPTAPVEIGYYNTPGRTQGIAVAGDYIYATDREGGLYVLRSKFSITGRVSHANGMPIENITISDGTTLTATTHNDGGYVFTNILDGGYTISPTLTSFTSLPLQHTVSLPPASAGKNFVILPRPISTTLIPGITTTLTFTDTQGLITTFSFSANAITQSITIVITPTIISNIPLFTFAGHAFEVVAYRNGSIIPDFTFNLPISISIHYNNHDIRAISNENRLVLMYQAQGEWADATQSCRPTSTYDISDYTISTTICQAGLFGLFGPPYIYHFPIIYRNGS